MKIFPLKEIEEYVKKGERVVVKGLVCPICHNQDNFIKCERRKYIDYICPNCHFVVMTSLKHKIDYKSIERFGFKLGDLVRVKKYENKISRGVVIAFDEERVIVAFGTHYKKMAKSELKLIKRNEEFSEKILERKSLFKRLALASKILMEAEENLKKGGLVE